MPSLHRPKSSYKAKNTPYKKENIYCYNILKECIKYNSFEKCKELEKMLDLCTNQGTNHFS